MHEAAAGVLPVRSRGVILRAREVERKLFRSEMSKLTNDGWSATGESAELKARIGALLLKPRYKGTITQLSSSHKWLQGGARQLGS